MFQVLRIPEDARNIATRFKWWQPSDVDGKFKSSQWWIDHVIVGSNLDNIDENFSLLVEILY